MYNSGSGHLKGRKIKIRAVEYKRYLKELFYSIKDRGLITTSKIIVSVVYDYWLDLFYKRDTCSWVWNDNLGVKAHLQAGTRFYVPTSTLSFKSFLYQTSELHKGVFLDIGSGKGRILWMAAETRKFKEIRCVEFSPNLNRIAKNNLINLGKATKLYNITIVENDIRDFSLSDDETFTYLFDPFDRDLIEALIETIRKSLEQNPRVLFVAYCSPLFRGSFESRKFFKVYSQHSCWGHEFVVYQAIEENVL